MDAHLMDAPDNKISLIQAAQVRMLFGGIPASIVSSTTLAALLAYMQRSVISTVLIVGWLALIVAIAAARASQSIWYRRAALADADSNVWLQRFRLGVVISGAGWGLAGWLLFPAGDAVHQVILGFVLAGLSAGAAATYSVDILCIIAFLLPALVPYVLRLFIEGGDISELMGIAVMLFIGFMLASMRQTYRRMHENIVLRIEAVERERTLQISESRFRHMFEGHTSVMLLVDPATGAIVNANAAASRFYGYTIDQMCSMNLAEINTLGPEEIAIATQQAVHGDLNHFVFPHRLASGEVRTVEIHSSPIEVDGRTQLFSIVHDITDRQIAEARLQLHDAALNAAANAIVITNKDGLIVWVNQAFTQMTGYPYEEAVGRLLKERIKSGVQNETDIEHLWQTIFFGQPWHGELINQRKDGSLYHEEMTITPVRDGNNVIGNFVAIKQDISERKQAEEKIYNLAFYDPLTRLPNRRLLNDRLRQTLAASRRSGRHAALMFLDLDNFKPLNDLHGHNVGDLLLIEVAHRISYCVREVDTIARFGGDEFVVMLSELDVDKAESISQAGIVAEKIRAALAEPYVLSVQQDGGETTVEHHCTSSIGVVMFINHEISPEDILKWADMAMYQAKEGGRNQVCFYK
jgi:diguanylate cyclase (GGDEF)-like protein/PAS domain S-box-containing protein